MKDVEAEIMVADHSVLFSVFLVRTGNSAVFGCRASFECETAHLPGASVLSLFHPFLKVRINTVV